jgi:excisionase family DNA binding protein
MDDEILTIPETARYLKISKSKIYWLVATKQLPHIKIQRNVRIRRVDLEKWLEGQLCDVAK